MAVAGLASLSLAGCGVDLGEESSQNSESARPADPYCPFLPSKTFSPSVTVSGRASYQYRIDGNGIISSTPNPIRFAEVRVTDESGAVVQCAETQADGSFFFPLPHGASRYTVAVTSRSLNSSNKAYVLDSPYSNGFYSVSAVVLASAATQDLSLVAPADGTLEGGAFNILDQILKAQEFIRASTAGCDSPQSGNHYPGCTPFAAAPLVSVYWAPGVSPGRYIGQAGPISFYKTGYSELYILGGLNGDTDTADMDHFDNSVIIHEYAHFLEDRYGKPNSPGGSHNGNSIIDPRLAWGEGWADFFQAAVTGSPFYRDTYGHVGCAPTPTGRPCTGVNFYESLDSPGLDIPSTDGGLGEGNFREFSVARVLWSAIRQSGGPVSPFAEIWTVFAALRDTSDPFKHIGRFHKVQSTLANRHDWSSLIASEAQVSNMSAYAIPLTINSGCASPNVTMNIRRSDFDNGSFYTSDLFRNNRFFSYQHPGGAFSIKTQLLSANGPVDLDLYLLQSNYVYGDKQYWIDASNTSASDETISAYLPAGTYMIHVMAFTGIYTGSVSRQATFSLRLNGQVACPGQ